MSEQERPYLQLATVSGGGVYLVNKKLCVCEPLGMVFSHRTQGIAWYRDLFARIRDFFGGAVKSYDKPVYRDLIIPCLRDLSDQAYELYGTPDVVIAVSYDVNSIGGKGMSMMSAFAQGTAARWVELPSLPTQTVEPAVELSTDLKHRLQPVPVQSVDQLVM